MTRIESRRPIYFCIILTERVTKGPTNTRTEGRAPVWRSELTTKAAKQQGDSVEFLPRLFAVALGPFVARARVSFSRGFPGGGARRAAT